MAITRGDYIDNENLSTILTKINAEVTRRGLTGSLAIPTEGTLIDDSFFNSAVTKINEIHGSHCYCQTNACNCQTHTVGGTNGGAIVSHLGCPSNSVTMDSSSISEGSIVLGEDSPDTIPDILEIDSDIKKLETQTVTITSCGAQCSCDANYICTCDNVCPCQSVCFCNLDCSCNRDCCQTYCSCDVNCGCHGDCGCDSYCSCEGYTPCSCDSFCGVLCGCVGNACPCESYTPCDCVAYNCSIVET